MISNLDQLAAIVGHEFGHLQAEHSQERMNVAGFQPQEAVTLWQRMEAAATSRPPAFLTTHPAPQSRIEAIKEMLPELK